MTSVTRKEEISTGITDRATFKKQVNEETVMIIDLNAEMTNISSNSHGQCTIVAANNEQNNEHENKARCEGLASIHDVKEEIAHSKDDMIYHEQPSDVATSLQYAPEGGVLSHAECSVKGDSENCDADEEYKNKITRTFSLAFAEHKAEIATSSIIPSNLEENSHDYFLTDLDACEKHNSEFGSKTKSNELQETTAFQKTLTPPQSTNITQYSTSHSEAVAKEIIHDKVGVSIVDLDSYNEDMKLISSNDNNPSSGNLNNSGNANFFSAEIHVVSSDSHVDFLAEKTPKVLLAPNNSFFSDHSYHHVPKDSDQTVEKCDTKGDFMQHKEYASEEERLHIAANTDGELENNPYEGLEFSTIFSTLDDYHHPYYASYAQSCINSDSPRYITDLDNQICNESVGDSGIFNISMIDSGTSGFFSRDDENVSEDLPRLCQIQNNDEALPNDLFPKSDKLLNSPSDRTGNLGLEYLDANTFHYEQYPSCSNEMQKETASTATSSSATLPDSLINKLHADPSLHESCSNDCYKQYQNYDNCYCQTADDCSSAAYTSSAAYPEWSSWGGFGPSYENHSGIMSSKQSFDNNWYSPSINMRDDVTTPDIVRFLQMEVNEDEETDDADEVDDMPLHFSACDSFSDHNASTSVATISYHSDDSSVVTTYSPQAQTPPPSASSTPVPSSSQDSHSCEDLGFFSPWPVSHYEASNLHGTTSKQLLSNKLSTEQLETGLLNYGLSQGIKRPFPSMADAMRNSRTKSLSSQKFDPDSSSQVFRPSGRPRKNRIQSDKISTSTTMDIKHKKKKLKYDDSERLEPCNSLDDAGSSSGLSRAARHNEPLNQQAIEIMTQWFEEHVHNPYPSKSDKEEMARLGGITENQVKSWFANKRNRTNNTKPKVQKRAMEEKLKELFRDLKRNHRNPMADNSHLIQQLSGIIQNCHSVKPQN